MRRPERCVGRRRRSPDNVTCFDTAMAGVVTPLSCPAGRICRSRTPQASPSHPATSSSRLFHRCRLRSLRDRRVVPARSRRLARLPPAPPASLDLVALAAASAGGDVAAAVASALASGSLLCPAATFCDDPATLSPTAFTAAATTYCPAARRRGDLRRRHLLCAPRRAANCTSGRYCPAGTLLPQSAGRLLLPYAEHRTISGPLLSARRAAPRPCFSLVPGRHAVGRVLLCARRRRSDPRSRRRSLSSAAAARGGGSLRRGARPGRPHLHHLNARRRRARRRRPATPPGLDISFKSGSRLAHRTIVHECSRAI